MHISRFAISIVPVVFMIAIAQLAVPAIARDWTMGQALTFNDGSGITMPYRVYYPKNYDPNGSYPLITFMHGSGERGNDNAKQVKVHIAGLIDKTFETYPAILVAPQLPSGNTFWSTTGSDRTPAILQHLIATQAVDTNRLYITGLSLGGFGTMDYLDYTNTPANPPFEFAAAVPMSGGYLSTSNPDAVEHFNHVPTWLIHAKDDGTVSSLFSSETYKALTGLESSATIAFNQTLLGYPTAVDDPIRYTERPTGGHVIWSGFYNDNRLYDWMFSQALPVPEPSSWMIFVAALPVLALMQRRRRHCAK